VGADLGLGQGGGLPGQLGQLPAQVAAERAGGQEGLGAGRDPVGVDPLAVVGLLVARGPCTVLAAAGVLVVASATSNSMAAAVLQVLSDAMMLVLLGGWPGAAARTRVGGARTMTVR
jgi:hypothetical protein